jgi:hypothetical protein
VPTKLISTDYDFQNVNRPFNVPASVSAGQVVVHEQLDAALGGLAFKDNARVRTASNITLSAPGATLDGIAMVAGDRFVAAGQTAQPENGIYVWTGAATPATRATDANTSDKLESAIVSIDEGTSAGTTWRQSTVNFVLGTGNVVWTAFGTGTPAASETVSGAAELATQAETDAGVDDLRIVTPLKLRTAAFLGLTKEFTIGDGTATSFTITHNWNTKKVGVIVREAAGLERDMDVEINRNAVNTVVVKATPAIALNGAIVYVTRLGIAP